MRILVTGSSGMLGNAFQKISNKNYEWIFINHKDADLTYELDVARVFRDIKPDWLIHCAGVVGGVKYNLENPVKLYEDNTLMNSLLLRYAHEYKVKKLAAFISSCSFPDDKRIIVEDDLHLAPAYAGNMHYAMAKRALDVHINAYRQQFKYDWFSVIPSNMFGEHDNFDLENGHVVATLIHKGYKVWKELEKKLTLWGDGSNVRSFVYTEDVARITLKLMEKNCPYDKVFVSICSHTIAHIAELICFCYKLSPDIIEFSNELGGVNQREVRTDKLQQFLPDVKFTHTQDALQKTIDWFKVNYPQVRGAS